ncbi:MAG: TetR family transcriptional regulator [Micrococcales bacterium 73-13]|nr:MAG: TetR family transcriptional regulator [Micrococcales bacterium 73-13]
MARRSATATRAAILDAARALFRDRGYAGASVRDIAAAAHSDPALVIRHFGSKERLFLDAIEPEALVQPLTAGPLETLGRDFVRFLLDPDDDVRGIYLALIRASDGAGFGSRLREMHEVDFVLPLRARLTGPDADLRARLAAALAGGLLYSLWLVGDEGLRGAEPEEVVERYGSALQQLLTPGSDGSAPGQQC